MRLHTLFVLAVLLVAGCDSNEAPSNPLQGDWVGSTSDVVDGADLDLGLDLTLDLDDEDITGQGEVAAVRERQVDGTTVTEENTFIGPITGSRDGATFTFQILGETDTLLFTGTPDGSSVLEGTATLRSFDEPYTFPLTLTRP